ncbi:hypothetical protein [Nocardiopsis quinghaiensis]|uniref:hypothetical protein n=1 Tax=Nocardiopsis quinghaiensis TaxID=464995 RepID=UPI001238FB91|nr:hypothetical protein [Nocardiopsis quinghaiensis]
MDQTRANAHAHLDALTSSLDPWAEPVGLGELAREIRRLIDHRPDLARPAENSAWSSLIPMEQGKGEQ